jgi:hypothetical protein
MTFLYTKILKKSPQMYVEIQRKKKMKTWNTPKHDYTKDNVKTFLLLMMMVVEIDIPQSIITTFQDYTFVVLAWW